MAEAEKSDFEREEYGDMDEGLSQSQYQQAANDLLVKPHCSTDSCTAAQEEPAEAAWVKLMSAVPQAGQTDSIRAAREGTMLLPEGKTMKDLVSSIRPQPEADYALDTLRDEWLAFYEDFRIIGPKLEQGLADLSNSWKGDDFDAFEEQVEIVLRNCRTICDDIAGEKGDGGVVKLLDDKQAEIFEQQGGTACAYPAPKFYMEGTKCGSHRIHIRPPFYRNCVIEENDEIKHAVELAGFDPTVVDEVQEGRENRYQQWLEFVNNNPDYEENGLSGEPLAKAKADEYADQALVDMGAKGSEQLEEQSSIVNEDVTDRHSNVEAQVTEIEPEAKPAEPSEFSGAPGDGPAPPDLDGGPDVGGPPDLGGDPSPDLSGMSGPDTSNLSSLTDTPGGPDGAGMDASKLNTTSDWTPPEGYSGGDLNGLDEDNPFSADIDDPDGFTAPPSGYDGSGSLGPSGLDGYGDTPPNEEYGGGLASGGPGSLPGGGTPPTGGSSPGLSGGGPGVISGSGLTRKGFTPRPGSTTGLRPGSSGTGPRVLNPRATTGGAGLRPGSSSTAGLGRLGSSSTSGSFGRGSGGGGPHGMIPGGAGAGGGKDEGEHQRQVWLVEDEDVWGGGPEDEEEDPFA